MTLPIWRIHRAIGMGGDQLVEALAGEEVEHKHGDGLRDAWVEEFDPMLGEIKAIDGATDRVFDSLPQPGRVARRHGVPRRRLTVQLAAPDRE